MKRILVGIDFSAPARSAALWAARQFGDRAELVLMHAIHLPEPPRMIGGSQEHRIQRIETSRRGAELRLAELKVNLRIPRVRTRIRVGRPADELARAARQAKAALIVVGEASDRTGLYRVVGSTVEGLIRQAPVPVLLHRGSPEDAPKRLLVAVDGSPRTAHVLAEARQFASHFKTDVTVLQVVSAGLTGSMGSAASERERSVAVQQLEASLATQLEAIVAALRTAGVWAESMTVSGDPATRILDVSRELRADLIIIGLRRQTALERALVGAVAHEILREADCSVLVALPPE